MTQPNTFTIELSSSTGPDIGLQVVLTMNPKFNPGAMYEGKVSIGEVGFEIVAIAIQSTAGGRALMAWDERLEKRFDHLESFAEKPLLRTVVLGHGEYVIAMFPEQD